MRRRDWPHPDIYRPRGIADILVEIQSVALGVSFPQGYIRLSVAPRRFLPLRFSGQISACPLQYFFASFQSILYHRIVIELRVAVIDIIE